MKNFRVLTSLLIVFSILISSLFAVKISVFGGEILSHKIAGYGPMEGDLLLPISSKFDDKYFYVMESFGISMFDVKSGDFVKELKVDTGYSEFMLDSFDVNTFFRILKGITDFSGLTDFFKVLYEKVDYIPNVDFALDSEGLIYVLGFGGINIYEPEKGERIGKIDINFLPKKAESEDLVLRSVSFKIYNDIVYVLFSEVTYSEEEEEESKGKTILYKLDLKGKPLSEILFTSLEEETIFFLPIDFAISQDGLIGIIAANGVAVYSEDGKYLCSYEIGDDLSFVPLSLDFKDNTIFTTGLVLRDMMMPAERTSIFKFEVEKSEEDKYTIKEAGEIKDENFGFSGIDIYTKEGKIAILTTGKLESLLYYKALLISEEEVKIYGKFPDSEGQIYGSISFAVSSEGNLYETNVLSPYIDVYNKDGEFTKRIEIDTSVVSSMMGVLTLPPTILDMEIDGDDLYVYNLFPTNISKYSIKDGEWSIFWADDMMGMDLISSLPIDMRVFNDNVYLLQTSEESPTFSIISQTGEIEEEELTITPEQYKPEFPPFWFGFCITNSEYQVLDGINRSILIFDRNTKSLKSVVNLSEIPSIYTSIDVHPDGGWIVTDVSRNAILRYGRDGKYIEKIVGKVGFVPRKVSKEAYKGDPDKFFGLVRAKTGNRAIYANDFFNFRYHVITFEEGKKVPEVEFDPQKIELTNFSLRENKDLVIKFTVTPLEEDFDLNLSSNVSWIQFKKDSIKASEGKFDLTILGDNLEGWKGNSGVITVESPSFSELKKEIPIKVSAHGIIIELTIDEPEAFVITKVGELKIYTLDVPPTIKDGRTFVPLRFFSDAIGAEVLWDDKERKVTYTKKNFVIILYIDKKTAYVNGEEKELDVAPFIKNGRTLVPVRFVSENLDSLVEWNPKERTVRITYPKK